MKAKRKLLTALVASSLMLTTTAFASVQPTTPLQSMSSSNQSMSAKEGTMAVTNALISQELQAVKINGPLWLQNADLSIHLETDRKVKYSFETILPTRETARVTDFTQFRISNESEIGTIANLGFGRRFLSEDKTSMTGVNVFYDYGFKEGHARIGLGGEYFAGNNEYRVNTYHAISGEKEVDKVNHIFERALSGYDFDMATTLPNAPYVKFGVTAFHWGYKYSDNANGYKVRTELQVTPRLNLELGYWDDNKGPGEKYAKVMYSLSDNRNAMFGKDSKAEVKPVTVESKRLIKVKRENDIKVEKTSKADGLIISISRDN